MFALFPKCNFLTNRVKPHLNIVVIHLIFRREIQRRRRQAFLSAIDPLCHITVFCLRRKRYDRVAVDVQGLGRCRAVSRLSSA